ncbi:hypothetical protein [Vibrio phage vB_VpS_PG28]|nr:hypothetical protein [Vibrio phage vB_VpS_PG28]
MNVNTQLALTKFTLVRNTLRAAQNVTEITNPDDKCAEQLGAAVDYLNDMLVDIASQGIEPFGDIVWETINGIVTHRPTYNIETNRRVEELLATVKNTLLHF